MAQRLGTLYAVNVLGAILGSMLADFLLLPRFGGRVSLIVCAALYLDGLHQANDTADMLRVHRQMGHLAVMLHREHPLIEYHRSLPIDERLFDMTPFRRGGESPPSLAP